MKCYKEPNIRRHSDLVRHRKRGGSSRWDRIRFSGFIFACALLSQSASAQAPSASAPTSAIRGIVINSVTREPVGRALVVSADNSVATLTDSDGHFEIALPHAVQEENAGPPPQVTTSVTFGEFRSSTNVLFARKPGFLGPEREGGSTSAVRFLPGKELLIELVPEARIVGQVALPSGSSRLSIGLYKRQVLQGRAYWNLQGDVRARSSGEFRFFDLEPGTYKVFTRELDDRDPLTTSPDGPQYGYPPMYFPNATDFPSAGTIQLSPGITFRADLSPVRRRYYHVSIPVANAPTANLFGALEISVDPQGKRGPGFALGYNRRAQKIEGALPDGVYLVKARTQGESLASGEAVIAVKGGPAEGQPLTLLPAATVRFNARLELRSKVEASPSPSWGSGMEEGLIARAENFSVSLQPVDDFATADMVPRSVSQQKDTITFQGVPPGTYWVRLESPRGFVAAASLGDLDLLQHPLKVGPGANLAVEVSIRDGGAEISGVIEEGDGRPITDTSPIAAVNSAYLYCVPLPDSTGQFRQATAQSDGSFRLQELAPGDYRVLAFDRPQLGKLEYHNPEAMKAYDSNGQVIHLTAGQKQEIRVRVIASKP